MSTTDRGKQVIRPILNGSSLEERIHQAAEAGLVHWNGKRFSLSTDSRPRVRGKKSVAEMLIEDRESSRSSHPNR